MGLSQAHLYKQFIYDEIVHAIFVAIVVYKEFLQSVSVHCQYLCYKEIKELLLLVLTELLSELSKDVYPENKERRTLFNKSSEIQQTHSKSFKSIQVLVIAAQHLSILYIQAEKFRNSFRGHLIMYDQSNRVASW